MHGQMTLLSGYFGAALLVLSSTVTRADDPKQQAPSEVVMKSLDTDLLVDGHAVDTSGEFLRYRVEQVNGDWLWLVADCGIRGWSHRRDVVPADQAITFWSAAIAREPQSAKAYRMRGLSYYDAIDYRRAIRDASTAIRIDPSCAPAYVDRCYAKLAKNDLKGAMADASEAVRLDPKSSRAYRCRALVWQEKEQYKQAISDYDAAIRTRPQRPDAPCLPVPMLQSPRRQ